MSSLNHDDVVDVLFLIGLLDRDSILILLIVDKHIHKVRVYIVGNAILILYANCDSKCISSTSWSRIHKYALKKMRRHLE